MSEEKDIIDKTYTYEDWNILTRGNRSNHYSAELAIYGQKERAEHELSCDDEYTEKQPSMAEVKAYLKSIKRKKK